MSFKNRIVHNAGLIILIFFIALVIILIIFTNSLQASYNPPYLRLILNAVFISATNFFVAAVSVRSFLRYGQISFILLSSALIVSGLAAFMSGLVSGISANANFTIFNVGFFLSSVMQAFAAVYIFASSPVSKALSNRKTITILFLAFSIGSVLLVTLLSLLGLTPPFITPSGSTTDIRQFVVGLSFLFFVFASSIFAYQYLRTKARSLYWYSLALALFAIDTFVAYNSAQLADALQWVGRIADYVGGAFFILALLSLRQQVFAGADFSERWFETFSNNRVQFHSLFANMLSGFAYLRVVTGKDGNAVDAVFLEVNDAFETDTGLERAEILGKRFTQVIPGVDKDPVGWIGLFGRVALKGEPVKTENFMEGLNRWFRVSAYSPERGYVAVLFEDITERNKLQRSLEEYTKNLEKTVEDRTRQLRQSERLAGIGQTAGMVGHDIRNPLQAIVGDLFLIEQEVNTNPKCLSPEIAESIAAINENITYINKIVSDLQDYTRTLKPTFSLVSLKEVIGGALAGVKISPNISIEVLADTSITMRTDPTFLRRILTNLFTNAFQAMTTGGKLTIDASKEENRIYIFVQDTGTGIPEETKPNLFKPLFTTKAKGQGLGLAVVKRLVETLDGKITFESDLGKGTKFTIELPLESQ